MNAKRIFLSGIVATTCLAASAVIAAPRASGGSGSGAHFSGSSARFSGSPRFAGNRSAFARTSGVNSGHWHHHHGHVFFGGGFGYPYGYGYPWYDPYYYPYDYYDYNRPVVYEGAAAYDDGLTVQVQHRLARAGYYHGSVDGVMGPETRHAIRTYERSRNLRVDGAISDRLLDTMDIR
jgi:hypothetical protein